MTRLWRFRNHLTTLFLQKCPPRTWTEGRLLLQCLAHLHGPDFDPDSDLVSPAGVLQEEFQEIRAALLQNQECPPPKLDLLRAEKSFPTEHPIWKTLIFLLPLVPEATPWTIPQSPKSSRVGPTTAFPATFPSPKPLKEVPEAEICSKSTTLSSSVKARKL